jgi:hypothetical protein
MLLGSGCEIGDDTTVPAWQHNITWQQCDMTIIKAQTDHQQQRMFPMQSSLNLYNEDQARLQTRI